MRWMQWTRMFLAAVALAVAAGGAAEEQTKQKVVVHLSQFTDNLHAARMAVGLAHQMQKAGAEVTLLLDLEGVRLADARQPLDLVWGMGEPISKEVEGFVKAGGKILLCPHCAHHSGITEKNLRPGARIGKEGELAQVILAAAKVLDY